MSSDAIRLIPLASSSDANCTAIVAGGSVLVIDAGISRKQTIARLNDADVLDAKKPTPDALLLTHEHEDHARHVGYWLCHPQPIYCSPGTAGKLEISWQGQYRVSRPFSPIKFGELTMTPIMVAHDAAEPVAWRVAHNGSAAVVATDLGSFPPGWDMFVSGATDLLLEANYHPRLLALCKYPAHLKARISAADGHMDIIDVCHWLKEKCPKSLRRLWLGHLSKTCNNPRIVRRLAREALVDRPDVTITVLES